MAYTTRRECPACKQPRAVTAFIAGSDLCTRCRGGLAEEAVVEEAPTGDYETFEVPPIVRSAPQPTTSQPVSQFSTEKIAEVLAQLVAGDALLVSDAEWISGIWLTAARPLIQRGYIAIIEYLKESREFQLHMVKEVNDYYSR